MPPRHVGVRGCLPEPWQSRTEGNLRGPDPKGAARARLSPGANPKQGLVLLGSVQSSETRAGQVPVLLSLLLPAQHP